MEQRETRIFGKFAIRFVSRHDGSYGEKIITLYTRVCVCVCVYLAVLERYIIQARSPMLARRDWGGQDKKDEEEERVLSRARFP